jgi:hypothetical protein
MSDEVKVGIDCAARRDTVLHMKLLRKMPKTLRYFEVLRCVNLLEAGVSLNYVLITMREHIHDQRRL